MSPDLNPLDYWFWGHCGAEVMRTMSVTLFELKEEVETELSDVEERSVVHINKRIGYCVEEKGCHFKHKMRK